MMAKVRRRAASATGELGGIARRYRAAGGEANPPARRSSATFQRGAPTMPNSQDRARAFASPSFDSERRVAPARPIPTSISAQAPGSGTAVMLNAPLATLVLMLSS